MPDEPAPDEPVLGTRLVSPLPDAPAALGRRFTAGAVVERTLEVWWRHLLPFTVTSLAVYAPAVAASVLSWRWVQPGAEGGVGAGMVRVGAVAAVAVVAMLALAVVQAGAVTFGTVRYLAGEPAGLGEMLSVGARRGLRVVAAGLLVWVAVLAAALLLVLPGLVVMVATSVAVPSAVVERRGALAAFRRSLALTRGSRWPLFAAGLALVVVVSLLSMLAQLAAGSVAALVPGERAFTAALVLYQVANALFAAIPTVGIAVAYHDLRVAKEGVETEALARVFE
jgi:hypothetical protein